MSTLLHKPHVYHHADVVASVAKDIIDNCPDRWRKGRTRTSEDDVRKNLSSIQKFANELTETNRYSFSKILDYADTDIESFNEAVRLHLQEVLFDQVPNVEAKVKNIQKSILVVGSSQAEDPVNTSLSQLEQNARQLRQRQSGMSWQPIAQEVLKTKKSPLHQLLYKFGLNGKAIRTANDYLSCETNIHRFTLSERLLRKSLYPFEESNGQDKQPYRLPDRSELRQQIEEYYVTVALENEQLAKASLTRKIEDHLGQIIREIFFSGHNHNPFDYEVTQEVRNATGIHIVSKFVEELSVIPRSLHVDPGYVKLQSSHADVTKIILFAVVPSIRCIPELANMMDMIEERAQSDSDRLLYVTDIRTLFPQPYRETSGISLDEAVEVVLKALLTPNAAEFLRARTQRVDLFFPSLMGRKTYNTIEGLAGSLTFDEEKVIHDRFWLNYCENRTSVINQLDNFQCGRIGSGEPAQRFLAAKEFTGATRWQNAIDKLLNQTRIADTFYNGIVFTEKGEVKPCYAKFF